jgi:hypothetical protein
MVRKKRKTKNGKKYRRKGKRRRSDIINAVAIVPY